MPAPELRRMVDDDRDGIKALVLAGLAEHWDTVDPDLNPDLEDLTRFHSGSTTLVAEVGAEIVGTGTLVPRDPTTAELVRISVASQWRRSGLGQRIVDALADVAWQQGHQRLVCETTSTWTGVVAFWQACGFTVTHTADSPFGEDTWFERRRPQPS